MYSTRFLFVATALWTCISFFLQYHSGFRSQSSSWPTNPVEHYISTLSRSPIRTVIADLGCGDAALARALLPKGMIVLNYDLVSRDPSGLVVEADICTGIPLPGCENQDAAEQAVEGQIVDVCVCSLSLMSTNWVSCVRECWRILKMGYVYALPLGEFSLLTHLPRGIAVDCSRLRK